MTKLKKFTGAIALLFTVGAIAVLLALPAKSASLVFEGLSLWAACVLPSTLPFLFFCALFTRLKAYPKIVGKLSPVAGKVFRISGAGACCGLISALSGYPVGAKTLSSLALRGEVPKEELFRTSALATTSGPAFLVGAVGAGAFQSVKAGWLLLVSHLAAVWLVCFLLRFTAKQSVSASRISAPQTQNALSESLAETVAAATLAGASIAIFYAFARLLAGTVSDGFLSAILSGIVEMTSGCKALSSVKTPLALALSAFFVTFGGVCVLVQQLAFLTPAGVKPLPFICLKALQGITAAALCFALACAFGV